MLRSIREGVKGPTGKILLVIILVPFVFIGGMEFLRDDSANNVATVNGEPITRNQQLQEFYRLRNEIAGQLGEALTPDAISEERLLPMATERLTSRALVSQATREGGVEVPEQAINESIVSTPEFHIDGKFSKERMQQVLAGSGLTDLDFRDTVTEFIRNSQLQSGLARTGFATRAEASLLTKIITEERTLSWSKIGLDKVTKEVEIEESELAAFYETVADEYFTELSADVEYLLLDSEALLEPVDEQDIVEAYETEQASYIPVEQRNPAHILLEVSEQQSTEQARAKLEELRQRAVAGEDFIALAKEFSQDPGSAFDGGELGFIEQDGSFPPAFEDAVFATAEGELSEIVETDAGLHLIKVLAVDRDEFPAFDARRDFIEQQLQRSAARKLFIEQSQILADETYSADNLRGPADELGLTVRKAIRIAENGPVAMEDNATDDEAEQQSFNRVFSNRAVLDAIFSEEVLSGQQLSLPIEIDDGRVVVLHVVKEHPSRQETFAEVSDLVRQRLVVDKAVETMQAKVDQITTAVSDGKAFSEALAAAGLDDATEVTVTRNSQDLSRDFLENVFAANRAEVDGQLQRFQSASNDLYVYQLSAVGQSAAAAALGEELIQRQGSDYAGRMALSNYLFNLRNSAEITVNPQ